MNKVCVLWKDKPSYRRILIRRVSRQYNSYTNVQVWIKPNWRSYKYWFWNIQVFIIGTTKCNNMLHFRLWTYMLEIGW
jgi:hypothetical protein